VSAIEIILQAFGFGHLQLSSVTFCGSILALTLTSKWSNNGNIQWEYHENIKKVQ